MLHIDDEKVKIIRFLMKNKEILFSDLAKKLKISREPLHRKLMELMKENLIIRRKLGNLYLYSLNLANMKLHSLLSYLDKLEPKRVDKRVLDELNKIINESIRYVLFLENEKKDKRVVIFTNEREEVVKLAETMRKRLEYKYNIKINISVIDETTQCRKFFGKSVTIFNGERFYFEVANEIERIEKEKEEELF